ncbi:MAG: hypothetical protein AAGD40_00860, partial [Pseudomonadota bacterium]
MTRFRSLIPAAALAIAACAVPADDGPPLSASGEDLSNDPFITAEAVGEPRPCLFLRRVNQTKAISDRHLLWEVVGGDLYRTEFASRCQPAADDDSFRQLIAG